MMEQLNIRVTSTMSFAGLILLHSLEGLFECALFNTGSKDCSNLLLAKNTLLDLT